MDWCDIPLVGKAFCDASTDSPAPVEPQKREPTLKDLVRAPIDCADGLLQPEKDYGAADDLINSLRPLVAVGKLAEAVGKTLSGDKTPIQCKPPAPKM